MSRELDYFARDPMFRSDSEFLILPRGYCVHLLQQSVLYYVVVECLSDEVRMGGGIAMVVGLVHCEDSGTQAKLKERAYLANSP